MNPAAIGSRDFQYNAAIIEQQLVAGADFIRQLLIINANLVLISGIALKCCIKHKTVANTEFNRAIGKTGNTNFWPLQIAKDSDSAMMF